LDLIESYPLLIKLLFSIFTILIMSKDHILFFGIFVLMASQIMAIHLKIFKQ